MPEIVNNTPAVWDSTLLPGGYVCAALTADGEQCGEPVESEGCTEHSIDWSRVSLDQVDLMRKKANETRGLEL